MGENGKRGNEFLEGIARIEGLSAAGGGNPGF